MASKQSLSFAKRLELYNVLAAHCTKREDGFCDYAENWDDATIHASANATGITCSISAVSNLRLSMFGKLPAKEVIGKAIKQLELTSIKDRIAKIERYLNRSSAWKEFERD